MRQDDVTAELARFAVESRWEDIPGPVVREALRSILNFSGCAIGGSRSNAVERALRIFEKYSGPRTASIFGRTERIDIFAAAALNAMSSNVLSFDDTHVPTVIHPGSSVAPPLFALAEERCISGRDLLHAFVLGVEVCCRIGRSISPWHYSHGYLITSTCGIFGAAVGVGKLLGLSTRQMTWALGNAANQACGLVESLPDMAKSLAVGTSARGGLLAALLAEQDFTGGDRAVEGRFGFANVMGNEPDFTQLTAQLGERWELSFNAYKPYPTGVVLHPVIDACLHLRAEHLLLARDVARILVRGNPLLGERADRPSPHNGCEASLSVQHCCAIAFVDGAVGLLQFTDPAVARPEVHALRGRVKLICDPHISVEEAYVEIQMSSGAIYAKHVPYLRGSMQSPMSDAELEIKFMDQALNSVPNFDSVNAINSLWEIEAHDDVSNVVRFLTLRP